MPEYPRFPASASPPSFGAWWSCVACVFLFSLSGVGAESEAAASVAAASGLTVYEGVVLVPTPWGDGDSFKVRLADGAEHVIRIYGADCLETDSGDASLARRLREQRAHFGIDDIGTAVTLGLEGKQFTEDFLARPFSLHTAWATAPGRSGLPRFYAFVHNAEGLDLASELVRRGLARAHGVYRAAPCGLSADGYRALLADMELAAAMDRAGAWAHSRPEVLLELRKQERALRVQELTEREEALAARRAFLRVDPNSAPPHQLEELPGIGPAMAQRILEHRPFERAEDLLSVPGIGPATLERLRPHLVFDAP